MEHNSHYLRELFPHGCEVAVHSVDSNRHCLEILTLSSQFTGAQHHTHHKGTKRSASISSKLENRIDNKNSKKETHTVYILYCICVIQLLRKLVVCLFVGIFDMDGFTKFLGIYPETCFQKGPCEPVLAVFNKAPI